MSKMRDILLSGALIASVLAGPGALAAFLISGEISEPPLLLAQAAVAPPVGAGAVPAAARPRANAPLMTGVLYTSGDAQVDWNGVKIQVDNSSYAYLGGESVRMAKDSMGILRLDGGGVVFLCPGSVSRVSRSPTEGYNLNVVAGTTRFQFPGNTPFGVQAGGFRLTPGPAAAGAAPDAQATVIAEVKAKAKAPGVLVTVLQQGIRLLGGDARAPTRAAQGEILDVSAAPGGAGEATGAGTFAINRVPIPENVLSNLMSSSGASAQGQKASGTAYLCRSEELLKYSQSMHAAREMLAAQSEPGTVSLPAPPEAPVPELAPPVAPPALAPVALAPPGAPIPFDLSLLGPTAAGAGSPTADFGVTSPPVGAGAGGGGGGVVIEIISPS